MPVVWKPVLDRRRRRSRRDAARPTPTAACVGVIAWMHTFSPAKMWITGLDALRKPLLHLHTQADAAAAVVEHRHGLHEPQPGRPRRPRVRLSSDPARRRPQDRRRPRQRPRGRRAGRRLGAGPPPAWPRCARLRLARFGDNMRDVAVTEGDKVEAQLRLRRLGQHLRRQRPRRGRRRRRRRRDRHARDRVRRRVRPSRPSCVAGGDRHDVAALRRADRGRPAHVPDRRRLPRVHDELRGPRRAAAAARPRRAAADGRRLRLRRRGRLEDLGAAAHGQGDGRRAARRHVVHGGLHVPPRPGRAEDPRRAHARGLPEHRGRPPIAARSTRSASAAARTRCG